jgi:hypothetical protein
MFIKTSSLKYLIERYISALVYTIFNVVVTSKRSLIFFTIMMIKDTTLQFACQIYVNHLTKFVHAIFVIWRGELDAIQELTFLLTLFWFF